jgi:DNA repair exonuclease SbcCD ATPase subunit
MKFERIINAFTTLSKTKKIGVIGLAIALLTTSTSTAYIVHDPVNAAKLMQQIKQYREMIAQQKALLSMKAMEILGLDQKVIEPINKEVDKANKKIAEQFDKLNTLLSGKRDGKEVSAKEALQTELVDLSASGKDPKDITDKEFVDAYNSNLSKLQVVNTQLIDQITKVEALQREQETRVQKLMQLAQQYQNNTNASIQINNQLKQEQLVAQNLNTRVEGLKVKQNAIKSEIERINNTNAKVLSQKIYSQFDEMHKNAVEKVESSQ